MTATVQSGLVIVDKPTGWTSHDVVAEVRRLAGTRRVGHAGTLDPMATGVLVVGIHQATRLLGHLGRTDKAYHATIRLGQGTDTDDAEGIIVSATSAAHLTDSDIAAGVARLTGEIMQVPPQVSAVKVGGTRAYRRARAGERVELTARPATVHAFDVRGIRRGGDIIDVDASILCSSGTYVRSLTRDLGEALGVGGHLTHLRRTRVGPYHESVARTLEELAEGLTVLSMERAVAAAFPCREVTAQQAEIVAHGGWLPAGGYGPGPVGVLGPDGTLLALVEELGDRAKPLAVFQQ